MIQPEWKDKTGKNDGMLKLEGSFELCSRHTNGDSVYFAWNNWRKLLAWGGPERYRFAKLQMRVSTASTILREPSIAPDEQTSFSLTLQTVVTFSAILVNVSCFILSSGILFIHNRMFQRKLDNSIRISSYP